MKEAARGSIKRVWLESKEAVLSYAIVALVFAVVQIFLATLVGRMRNEKTGNPDVLLQHGNKPAVHKRQMSTCLRVRVHTEIQVLHHCRQDENSHAAIIASLLVLFNGSNFLIPRYIRRKSHNLAAPVASILVMAILVIASYLMITSKRSDLKTTSQN